MDTEFVLEALDEALEKGRPEIFNTDQGSQFTSRDFTSKLLDASIEVSGTVVDARQTTCSLRGF